jgi:cytochrome c oxidase assembly factor CtaG
MIAGSLAMLCAGYAIGVSRVWRAAGRGRGVSPLDVLMFVLGAAALAAALFPPLEEWAEHSLAAHMIQHELLMIVGAPLLAFSGLGVALAWLLPRSSQLAGRLAPAALHHVPAPALACLAHAAALWIWHLPRFYDAALAHDAVHALQHLSFFGTALWFWWSLTHGRFGRIGFGPAVLYLFATTVQSGALGALLVMSPRLWFTSDTSLAAAVGLTPLDDQQLAGLIMWVPASAIFVGAGLAFLAAWLRESERRARGPALVTRGGRVVKHGADGRA